MSGAENGLESRRAVTIRNRNGLHARPAAEFVKVSSRFESRVLVEKNGLEVNGKSIMGVMMLAAEFGSRIVIRAIGRDSQACVQALSELVENEFGERPGDYDIDDLEEEEA